MIGWPTSAIWVVVGWGGGVRRDKRSMWGGYRGGALNEELGMWACGSEEWLIRISELSSSCKRK